MPALVFDGLLAVGLVVLAWQAVAGTHLFRSVVLFIAFGLLMSIAWLRLGAPDIAMAEAAVGAGLTGVLLLNTLGRIGPEDVDEPDPRYAGPLRWAVFGGCLLLAGLIAWAVTARDRVAGLAPRVREQLGESGVENPVTAVLLNFRGLDTLIEVGVLVLAVVAVASLGRPRPRPESRAWEAPPSALLDWFIPRVAPVAVLVGAYLWWAGAKLPGGAFQGGTVVAAAGVMLLLSERPLQEALAGARLRVLVVLGFAGFLTVAALSQVFGGVLLEYPVHWAHGSIVAIESGLTLSIAACLFVLVRGAEGVYPERDAAGEDRA